VQDTIRRYEPEHPRLTAVVGALPTAFGKMGT
jgi:hypothetical protein